MLVWIPVCKLRKESPDLGVISMKDVGAMGMNVDGVFIEIIEAVSSDMISGTFTPSEISWKVQDSYEFPFMGLNFTLTDKLLKQMEDGKVAMLTDENWNEEGDAISYALFSWYTMTEEQRDAVIEKMGTGYDDWVKSLGKIGTLGVYSTDVTDQLDELTGCTEHTKLGESSDGKYEYYLSISKDADKKLKKELEKTKATYPFLIPDKNMMNGRLQGISAFPETFFVDKNGNIVGETYSGSHTLEEWKEIVEKELSAIKENN